MVKVYGVRASPQFDYWHRVLDLELLFLQFLRSQREQKYISYSQSLTKIIPWMFALDHYYYARWFTVHVNNLIFLKNNSPLTHKIRRKFSSLAHDQVHEQLNAIVKGDGGIICITENEAAVTRWAVSGPKTASF